MAVYFSKYVIGRKLSENRINFCWYYRINIFDIVGQIYFQNIINIKQKLFMVNFSILYQKFIIMCFRK